MASETQLGELQLSELREVQRKKWIRLIELFYQQVRYGCIDPACGKSTCRTYQTRLSGRRPYRVPSPPTAKHLASVLASEPDAISRLCDHPLKPMDAGDGAFARRPAGEVYDEKSLVQRLFSTDAWHRQKDTVRHEDLAMEPFFLSLRSKYKTTAPFKSFVQQFHSEVSIQEQRCRSRSDIYTLLCERMSVWLDEVATSDEQDLIEALVITTAMLVSYSQLPNGPMLLRSFDQALSEGPIFSTDLRNTFGRELSAYVELLANQTAARLALRLFRALQRKNCHQAFFDRIFRYTPKRSVMLMPSYISIGLWAKLVFRNTWHSKEVNIEEHGDAHVAIIFLDGYRAHGGYPDMSLEFIARSVDYVRDIASWMKSGREPGKVSLLDYSWLFSLQQRLVMFRHANYSLMLTAFERAMEVGQLFVRTQSTIINAASFEMRRQQIRERMGPAMTAFLVLQIKREHILEDALSQLWRREQRELRRPLKIRMGMDRGEEGLDLGGVQHEFFRLAIAKAMDPGLGFFDVDPVTKMAWFKPFSPAPLIQYALFGMLFGLAIYNSITLPITFPLYFYRVLLSKEIPSKWTTQDIQDGWPEISRNLEQLLRWSGDDFEDVFSLDFSFAVDLTGKKVSLDMTCDAPADAQEAIANDVSTSEIRPVTKADREEYVQNYVSWLLDKSVRRQLEAFLRGFRSIVADKTLHFFHYGQEFKERFGMELRAAVEGSQDIHLSELIQIAKYMEGYDENSPTIKTFWEVVSEYGQPELKSLLEFVTASERVPAAGMSSVSFIIQKSGDNDERLPTSMTCFSRLLLPQYSSKEIMRERLKVALENSEGFGIA